MKTYQFWLSEKHGLIRRSSGHYPEVWQRGIWRKGHPYVVDAITGMGEDPYSCGESADSLDAQSAAAYGAINGIDLLADCFDDLKSGST
jgi:hypothetical protein